MMTLICLRHHRQSSGAGSCHRYFRSLRGRRVISPSWRCSSISQWLHLETLPFLGLGSTLAPVARIPTIFKLMAMEALKRSLHSTALVPMGDSPDVATYFRRPKAFLSLFIVLSLNSLAHKQWGATVKRTDGSVLFCPVSLLSIDMHQWVAIPNFEGSTFNKGKMLSFIFVTLILAIFSTGFQEAWHLRNGMNWQSSHDDRESTGFPILTPSWDVLRFRMHCKRGWALSQWVNERFWTCAETSLD